MMHAPSFFPQVRAMSENPVPLAEQPAYVQRDLARADAQKAWQENAELREALRPFAKKFAWPLSGTDDLPNDTPIHCEGVTPAPGGGKTFASFGLTLGDFRTARNMLARRPR